MRGYVDGLIEAQLHKYGKKFIEEMCNSRT